MVEQTHRSSPDGPAGPSQLQAQKKRTLILLGAILSVMITLVATSPTLYDIFCDLTGYGGRVSSTLEVYARPDAVITGAKAHPQAYQVEVETKVASGAPIAFSTSARLIDGFHIGQRILMDFRVENTSNVPIKAQAVHQIYPPILARYMEVQECFCTSEQILEPGVVYDYSLVMRFPPEAADSSDVLRERAMHVSYEYLEKP